MLWENDSDISVCAGAFRKWFFRAVCEHKHEIFALVHMCVYAYFMDICVYGQRAFYEGARDNFRDHFSRNLNSLLGRFVFKKNILDRHSYIKVLNIIHK
jgi:hypothetical protein